jgi:Txe/YoeB family toxin of Txe-Axe toxin-antitoxin module
MTEEVWYHSDGSLWLRYVYAIKGNQKARLLYDKNGSLNHKYISTFDDKGDEIERLYFDTDKDKPKGKETYQYLEFDEKGNWTKRITSEGSKERKFVVKPREIMYRTITYF